MQSKKFPGAVLAPVWIKGKLHSIHLIIQVVSKIVRLEKLIWKGEDVWFDAVARRLKRELHRRFEVRAKSCGCYQAAWEILLLERADVEH